MERRNFLRTMLGVAGATALPSEMWPFRKIFLPAGPKIIPGTYAALSRATYPGRLPVPLRCADVTALQLETFVREIPDLIYLPSPLYKIFRGKKVVNPELIVANPLQLPNLKEILEDDYDDYDF